MVFQRKETEKWQSAVEGLTYVRMFCKYLRERCIQKVCIARVYSALLCPDAE